MSTIGRARQCRVRWRRQALAGSLFGIVICALLHVCLVGSATAATLDIAGGQLLGASAVDVDGSFFDVSFVDGTCIDLYNGCDEATDFSFSTSAEALAAALALLDQVLLDVAAGPFDNEPALTNGCFVLSGCQVLIPFDVIGGVVSVRSAVNGIADSDTTSAVGTLADSDDSSLAAISVYAVFTPVPEPGTTLLVGFGLLALSLRREGRHRDSVCS